MLFTLEFPPAVGGVAKYYHNLVRYFGLGQISVLAQKQPGEIRGELRNGNIAYSSLLWKLIWPKWLPAFFHLAREVIMKRINHVIVGQILPLGTVAYYLSKVLKFEYSIILHGFDLSLALRPKKRELALKVLSGAKKIICGNSYTARMAAKARDSLGVKISIVNPGIKTVFRADKKRVEELRSKYGLWGRIIVFSLGRLVKRKGFDKLIEAMPGILEKEMDIFYIMAGDGPDKEYLKKKINRLPNKARRRIAMLGEISPRDADAWYELSDIFAMPARDISGDFEGFGIVYMEANLAGKPVVAGDSGGVRDAVVDGLNGLLVDPDDLNAITGAVVKLAKNPKMRQRMGQEGRARAVKEFNWKGQITKIYKILKNNCKPD